MSVGMNPRKRKSPWPGKHQGCGMVLQKWRTAHALVQAQYHPQLKCIRRSQLILSFQVARSTTEKYADSPYCCLVDSDFLRYRLLFPAPRPIVKHPGSGPQTSMLDDHFFHPHLRQRFLPLRYLLGRLSENRRTSRSWPRHSMDSVCLR